MAVGGDDDETDVPGDVLVVGTIGFVAAPLVLGAFALIGLVDVLDPGAAAGAPLGADPTFGPGIF